MVRALPTQALCMLYVVVYVVIYRGLFANLSATMSNPEREKVETPYETLPFRPFIIPARGYYKPYKNKYLLNASAGIGMRTPAVWDPHQAASARSRTAMKH